MANPTLVENKEKNMKKVTEYIINHEKGVTIQEIAVDLCIPASTVRGYIYELVGNGSVVNSAMDYQTKVYTWSNGDLNPKPKTKPEPITFETALPTAPGGRDFVIVKPAHDVDQGDVIWISSRSGGGQFFRYLIITPWERKATVVGIVPEGHPILNLNDPRFVEIGTDPETGESLYADLSNFCSRAYAQFGEKLMHITKDRMNDVKQQACRFHRISARNDFEAEDISKLKNVIKNMKEVHDSDKAELTLARDALMKEKARSESLEELMKQSDKDFREYEKKYKDLESFNSDVQEQLVHKCEEGEKLLKEKMEAERLYNEALDENKDLREKVIALEEAAADAPVTDIAKDNALYTHISVLEAKLACATEHNETLKALLFAALKKGE